MSRYVLIHGAWHGGWYWEQVAELLRREGHQVETPDLPGNGYTRSLNETATLEAYTASTGQILASSPEPAILVGHSLGGLTITQAAEAHPEHIHHLVYLAAALIPNGSSLLSFLAPFRPAETFSSYLDINWEEHTCMVKPEFLDLLYSGCSPQQSRVARSRLVPQAMDIYGTPIATSADRFHRLPRTSLCCRHDPVIPPDLQEQMVAQTPCETHWMECGHFPMFSASEELAHLLMQIPHQNTHHLAPGG